MVIVVSLGAKRPSARVSGVSGVSGVKKPSSMSLAETEAAAAGGGEVVALAGARVGQKLYLPSALLARQLPAGLGAMQRVPRLLDIEADGEAARLELYISAIRRTARVFEVSQCKHETAVEHDFYMGWINSWACLSGFGSFVVVDEQVSARLNRCTGVGAAMVNRKQTVSYLKHLR